jgi:hypothetical protein
LATNFNDRVNRIFWQSGNVYVLLKTKGLFKSSGFADNFIDITESLTKPKSIAGVSYSSVGSVTSFSQVYVDIATPSLIYLTTPKGLYKTTDGGKTWAPQSLPIKPDKADTRAIAVSKTSSNIIFTSVGSTIYKSLDGGQTWQTQSVVSGGFINYLLIDPELPQIVYGGIYAAQ